LTEWSRDGGCYHLVVRLPSACVLDVGSLGPIEFPAGYYVYTGRARKNLKARIRRHLKRDKKLRWHIDYLVARGEVVGLKIYGPGEGGECELNERACRATGARPFARGFGASDCRCSTHLVYFGDDPPRFLGGARGRRRLHSAPDARPVEDGESGRS